jgi:hypothetical protein
MELCELTPIQLKFLKLYKEKSKNGMCGGRWRQDIVLSRFYTNLLPIFQL